MYGHKCGTKNYGKTQMSCGQRDLRIVHLTSKARISNNALWFWAADLPRCLLCNCNSRVRTCESLLLFRLGTTAWNEERRHRHEWSTWISPAQEKCSASNCDSSSLSNTGGLHPSICNSSSELTGLSRKNVLQTSVIPNDETQKFMNGALVE